MDQQWCSQFQEGFALLFVADTVCQSLLNSFWLHAGADEGCGETQQRSPKLAQCKARVHQILCLTSMEHRLGGRVGLDLGAAQEGWGNLKC